MFNGTKNTDCIDTIENEYMANNVSKKDKSSPATGIVVSFLIFFFIVIAVVVFYLYRRYKHKF